MKSLILVLIVFILVALGCSNSRKYQTPTPTPKPAQFASTPVANTATGIKSVQAETPKPSTDKKASIISETANLRKSPDKNSDVVLTIPKDTEVEIVKQQGAWFFVKYEQSSGWLHGNTIKLEYLNTPAILPEPTPSPAPTPIIDRAAPTPETSSNPSGATAKCRDGSLSYSAHRQGTCSHHGGVAEWY